MSLYTSLVRPILFRFEPETAHRFTLAALRVPGLARLFVPRQPPAGDKISLMGLTFRNRLGIAAGVDKNADAPLAWKDLGFGFAELGTVTFHPQPGNQKPRVFRYPHQQSLVNRLGFPNIGAKAFASRLRWLRTHQAVYDFPIGINLGKSKITPLPDAPSDYLGSLKILHALGDFFVINISSPNTPGLRDLAQPDDLRRLLSALQDYNRSTSEPKPLLLKISPDTEDRYLPDLVAVTKEFRLAGIVATNTTSQRTPEDPREVGGLTAAGGLYVDNGRFSTNNPVPMTFSFGSGVKSFAAEFSATDFDFNYLSGKLFEITLSDGTSFAGLTESISDPNRAFVGFVATGSTVITGFTIAVDSLGGPDAYATIQDMYLGAIPAPGALALIGAAALVGASRRRR